MRQPVKPTTSDATIASRPGRVRSIFRLLSSIRFDEVGALQGAPLIGVCFSLGALTTSHVLTVVAVLAGNLCLVAHVFVLNDWAGIQGDLKDPNRAARTFLAKGVSRSQVGYLALALLVLSLFIFGLVGVTTLVLALAIAGLSVLYSAPVFHMKGAPLYSSALHFTGGVLHFLLGYSAFAAIDARGVLVGCFFGLVFTAGHFTHEARGHEGDLLNGIRTNAVAFGKTRGFVAGLVLFTLAYALLVGLAAFGLVPFVLIFAAALYPLHLFASLWALRDGLTFKSLGQLQKAYRALFAIIGVAMILAVRLS